MQNNTFCEAKCMPNIGLQQQGNIQYGTYIMIMAIPLYFSYKVTFLNCFDTTTFHQSWAFRC